MCCRYLLFLGLLLPVLRDATSDAACSRGNYPLGDRCVDENECENEDPICGANAACYNTAGSYYCQCVTGYPTKSRAVNFTQETGGECEDINECKESEAICDSNAKCSNIPGSYYCMCVSGFVASNGQEQFNTNQNVACNDNKKHSEDNKPSVFCTGAESSGQQFKPTVSTLLPLIVCIPFILYILKFLS